MANFNFSLKALRSWPIVSSARFEGSVFVDEFLSGLDAGNREIRGVEYANLHEYRCLIPIDVLIIKFVAAESNNGDKGASKYLPVGTTAGSIQFTSISWVKQNSISKAGAPRQLALSRQAHSEG
jgi:hypothetical protein